MLRLEHVSKRFTTGVEVVTALDGVDLKVDEGEFVAMVGPSGSGKSTLLHVAGGLDVPDEGQVIVGDRDIATLDVGKRALLRRREVGFVFQFFHLIPSLTVVENVTLPLVLDGKRSHNGQVDQLLERMGIGNRRDHLPGELSGGEMQRAAIARALVHGPALVLADEPTGNLDSANAAEVLDLLCTEVTDAGAALLVVTHDERVANRADRICTLQDGRVV